MKQAQQGIILVTVLIFLLIIALLSLSALNVSQLQVRMSYNVKDRTQTLQAVEAGLKTAEKQLLDATKPNCFSAHKLPIKKNPKPWLQLKNTCEAKLDNISVKYFIEQLASQPCRVFYQITAWTNDNYPTIVQTIYVLAASDPSCEKNYSALGQLLWRELN